MKLLLSRQGFFLKLRHWPPGTDNLPFVPPFFCLLDGHFDHKLNRGYCNPVTEPLRPRYT